MAEGQHCDHCWWQEVDHFNSGEFAAEHDPDIPVDGYKFSAHDCPGFKPEDPEAEFLFIRAKLGNFDHSSAEEFAEDAARLYQETEYGGDVAKRMKIQFTLWQERKKGEQK